MTAAISGSTTLSIETPADTSYQLNEGDVSELFRAAGRGDINTVLVLIVKLRLKWSSFDIANLTGLSKFYGPLETNGDALMSLLQSHKGGKLTINEYMRAFLQRAEAEMTKAGKTVPSDIKSSINKLLAGQDLSEDEAKKLYTWCLESKLMVIPSQYWAQIISSQLKALQDTYEGEVVRGSRQIEAFVGR